MPAKHPSNRLDPESLFVRADEGERFGGCGSSSRAQHLNATEVTCGCRLATLAADLHHVPIRIRSTPAVIRSLPLPFLKKNDSLSF